MPVPMICLESTLRQYAESFRGAFTRPQFQHFVTVPSAALRTWLLGFVLSPQRCTLTGLLTRVAGSHSLSALSRFFSDAPWSPQELANKWLARFRCQLAPQIKAEHARQRTERPRRRGRQRRSQVTAFVIPSTNSGRALMTRRYPSISRENRADGWLVWESITVPSLKGLSMAIASW